MIPIQQQLAAITTSSESFTLIVLILGALFTLIGGSYIFTWMGMKSIWEAITELYTNDLKHIKKRLFDLEKTRKDPPA